MKIGLLAGGLILLAVMATEVMAGKARLFWLASESPEVTAYNVYHTLTANPWPVGWNIVSTTTNTSFTHTNLGAGNNRWIVTALGSFGIESDPSEEVELALTKPAAPMWMKVHPIATTNIAATLYRSLDSQDWEPVGVWNMPTNSAAFFYLEVKDE
jgi:predicted phage tail protein